jgi:hypothetical protein
MLVGVNAWPPAGGYWMRPGSSDKRSAEEYGQGKSTGLDQTAAGKILTGFTREDLTMTPGDRDVLRRLAERVAGIATSARMAETRRLWTRLNRLQRVRPLIFCDPENGWNEIITETQMECRGKLARRWEMDLRKEIFWGEVMGDDKPVEPYFDVPYTVSADDWGFQATYHKTEASGSYVWEGAIKDYQADLPRLHAPQFEIDWETTHGCVAIANEVLGDLLEVRLKGIWWWSLGLTCPAVTLRGLQNVLCDFIDHPDGLKELLHRLSQGFLAKLDYLEANHLLSLNNDGTYVGSGGFGFTDELPGKDFQGHVRAQDLWGFTESQETVQVSPAMYEQFVFPYEQPIMERFGLTCYGCCEPLHGRWQVVRRHHGLRRVSCSPWANVEKMADYLGDHYVFSLKPNPALLAVPEIDTESLRHSLRETLEKTHGCLVEMIMKDNHTLANRPENAVTWCRIAREEAERLIA